MKEIGNGASKKLCRLCYYETTDTIEIFSEKGIEHDIERKINRYLYLKVLISDNQPKTICWMCSQHLETFHKFYEKINEIQKSMLEEAYELSILKPIYDDYKQDGQITDDNETVEVLVINPDNDINYIGEKFDGILPEVLDQTVYDNLDQDDQEQEIELNNSTIDMELIEEEQDDSNMNIKLEHDNSTVSALLVENVNNTNKSDIDNLSTEFHSGTDDLSNTEIFINESNSPKKIIKSENRKSICIVDDYELNISPTDTEKSTRPKRKRGRPSKLSGQCEEIITEMSIEAHNSNRSSPEKSTKRRRLRAASKADRCGHLPLQELEEGESDNEFPARDSDNEDWPAQATLDEFPKQILENGYLLVKGKKLMSMISKYYNLECDQCPEKSRFKQLRDLFYHYSNIHNQEGYVKCCQTKLSRYPAIIMHMARHLQPDAFKCDECGYMVTRPRFLKSHKQTHLPEEMKPYKCDECQRRFCWKGALQIHMISHQKPEDRKLYVCHICGKVYDTPGGLSTHKKQIHTEKKPSSNVCHVCAKKFATRTGLNEHMSTIHQPREKDQVQCVECGKWLMNQRCLKSHMILHSDTIFNCPICQYSTKKKILLKRHLLTQHSDEKPYSCDLCNKSYKLKRALTVHIAQHNSSKSFKCNFCDRQFASSTNFYTHRKNMHPVELQSLKDKVLEQQRLKRIKAGIEPGQLPDDCDEQLDELESCSETAKDDDIQTDLSLKSEVIGIETNSNPKQTFTLIPVNAIDNRFIIQAMDSLEPNQSRILSDHSILARAASDVFEAAIGQPIVIDIRSESKKQEDYQ